MEPARGVLGTSWRGKERILHSPKGFLAFA
jgi:hypothetical protein